MKSFTQAEVIETIKELVRGNSQKKIAKEWHVSPAYFSDVIRGRREPGKKILKAMGLKKVVRYE